MKKIFLFLLIGTFVLSCIPKKHPSKFDRGSIVCILPEFRKAVVIRMEHQKEGYKYWVSYFGEEGRETIALFEHEIIDCKRIKDL